MGCAWHEGRCCSSPHPVLCRAGKLRAFLVHSCISSSDFHFVVSPFYKGTPEPGDPQTLVPRVHGCTGLATSLTLCSTGIRPRVGLHPSDMTWNISVVNLGRSPVIVWFPVCPCKVKKSAQPLWAHSVPGCSVLQKPRCSSSSILGATWGRTQPCPSKKGPLFLPVLCTWSLHLYWAVPAYSGLW